MIEARIRLESVKLEKSFSDRLKEVYRLEKEPETLSDWAEVWKTRLLRGIQTPEGKSCFDTVVRGELVFGATKSNTRHVVKLEKRGSVHVNCALDALVEGFFQDIDIESSCPHCEDKIAVSMASGRIVSASPLSTVLWLGISPYGEGPTTEVLCPFINLFSSQSHLKEWRERNPEQVGVLLDLPHAHEFIAGALPSSARKSWECFGR